MVSFFKKLFSRKSLTIDTTADTIPESIGYSKQDFDILTNSLTNFLDENNKVSSFATFVNHPEFPMFHLDLTSPNDSMALGYAFCAAVILQRSIKTQTAVNQALEAFYPPKEETTSAKN